MTGRIWASCHANHDQLVTIENTYGDKDECLTRLKDEHCGPLPIFAAICGHLNIDDSDIPHHDSTTYQDDYYFAYGFIFEALTIKNEVDELSEHDVSAALAKVLSEYPSDWNTQDSENKVKTGDKLKNYISLQYVIEDAADANLERLMAQPHVDKFDEMEQESLRDLLLQAIKRDALNT